MVRAIAGEKKALGPRHSNARLTAKPLRPFGTVKKQQSFLFFGDKKRRWRRRRIRLAFLILIGEHLQGHRSRRWGGKRSGRGWGGGRPPTSGRDVRGWWGGGHFLRLLCRTRGRMLVLLCTRLFFFLCIFLLQEHRRGRKEIGKKSAGIAAATKAIGHITAYKLNKRGHEKYIYIYKIDWSTTNSRIGGCDRRDRKGIRVEKYKRFERYI